MCHVQSKVNIIAKNQLSESYIFVFKQSIYQDESIIHHHYHQIRLNIFKMKELYDK